MPTRNLPAWIVFGAAVALPSATLGSGAEVSAWEMIVSLLTVLAHGVIGLLIILRGSGNRMGWVFLGVALSFGATLALGSYVQAAGGDGGSRVLVGAAAVIASVTGFSYFTLLGPFLLSLFPDGRPLSRAWALIPAAAGLGILLQVITVVLRPGPFFDFPEVVNPFGTERAAPLVEMTDGLSWSVVNLGLLAAVVSIVLRYRRSRGLVRLQIRWLLFASLVFGLAVLVVGVFDAWYSWGGAVFTLASLSLPAAAGIAILRHRLFDIDLVIRRTLVYGMVAAVSAGLYAAGAVTLGGAFRTVLGIENDEPVVAASTLLVAWAFRPLVGRANQVISRVFYRSRYDVDRTIRAFASTVQATAGLDHLRTDLPGVVGEAIHPRSFGIWVRHLPLDETKEGLRPGEPGR